MALSDAQVRSAKPRDKNYKLYDADGLFVVNGGRIPGQCERRPGRAG